MEKKTLLSEAADECWMSNVGNWLVQCMNGGRCPMAYYNNCGQEDSDESCSHMDEKFTVFHTHIPTQTICSEHTCQHFT